MKLTLSALMMGIVVMTTTGLRADTTLFGSIEQGLQVSDNGTSEIVAKGTIIGAKFDTEVTPATEESSGPYVFGTLSGNVDPTGPNAITTRDAFVGIRTGPVSLSLGRMPNVQDSISEATVGIFAEGSNLKSVNSTRNSNTAKAQMSLFDGDVNLVGTTVVDGSDGKDGVDSWEVGYSHSLFGINLVSAYAKDENTGIRTVLGGATTDIGPVTLGGLYEQDKDSAGETTDSLTAAASIGMYGNTLKGGYQTIESGAKTYMAEVEHSFNDQTSAFVNGKVIDDDVDDKVLTVGFRFTF